MPLSKTGAEIPFEVFSQRCKHGAILVTSTVPFDEWTEIFDSGRLSGALLDRLTHHVPILEMNGESYWLNRSRTRQASPADRSNHDADLPPWAHRPLPSAPPRQPDSTRPAAARVAPSRGLRGHNPQVALFLRRPLDPFCSAVDTKIVPNRSSVAATSLGAGRHTTRLRGAPNCAKLLRLVARIALLAETLEIRTLPTRLPKVLVMICIQPKKIPPGNDAEQSMTFTIPACSNAQAPRPGL